MDTTTICTVGEPLPDAIVDMMRLGDAWAADGSVRSTTGTFFAPRLITLVVDVAHDHEQAIIDACRDHDPSKPQRLVALGASPYVSPRYWLRTVLWVRRTVGWWPTIDVSTRCWGRWMDHRPEQLRTLQLLEANPSQGLRLSVPIVGRDRIVLGIVAMAMHNRIAQEFTRAAMDRPRPWTPEESIHFSVLGHADAVPIDQLRAKLIAEGWMPSPADKRVMRRRTRARARQHRRGQR